MVSLAVRGNLALSRQEHRPLTLLAPAVGQLAETLVSKSAFLESPKETPA